MRPVTEIPFDPVFVYGLEEIVGIVLGLRFVGLLRVEPGEQHEGVHKPRLNAPGEKYHLAGTPGVELAGGTGEGGIGARCSTEELRWKQRRTFARVTKTLP